MTDTRELKEELRLIGCHANGDARCTCVIGQDAADTITALSERNRVLEEALRFYADTSKYPAPLTGGYGDLYFDCGRVARAAITSGGRG